MKDIVIIGAGGFGREVAWLIEDINKVEKKYNILGFIDENETIKGNIINGYKVLGNLDYFNNIDKEIYFVVAIGNAKVKKELASKAIKNKGIPENIIHPTVIMSEVVELGTGIIICAGNIITTNIIIEDFVTINLACTVGHDVVIKKYTTVYPSVSISGNCSIGECSEIGTRSAIIQGISIGDNTITGAGSVVIRNSEGNYTLVGVPAKSR